LRYEIVKIEFLHVSRFYTELLFGIKVFIIELYAKIARILPLNIFNNPFYSSLILEIIHSFFSH